MSDGISRGAFHPADGPQGPGLLARDLTEDELAAAPVLVSAGDVAIEDLSDEEYDAFVAALSASRLVIDTGVFSAGIGGKHQADV